MQPSNATDDVPNSQYLMDYNPEVKRKLGRGTCSIHRQLLEAFTRINISAPHQSGLWVLQLASITFIIGAWYGPVNSNYRTINERKAYWTAWAKALWRARDLYPTAAIIAGGDANVILHTLHPEHAPDGVAEEFEELILKVHGLQLANLKCPRRTHTKHALDLLIHSTEITIEDFFVHDGTDCNCGKPCCGPIAGSDHAFLTATLNIQRPAECLLESKWTWSKDTDWSNTINKYGQHFTLLACNLGHYNKHHHPMYQPRRTPIANKRHLLHMVHYDIRSLSQRWQMAPPTTQRRINHIEVAPWWNESCATALHCKRRSPLQENTAERTAAHNAFKAVILKAKQQHQQRRSNPNNKRNH